MKMMTDGRTKDGRRMQWNTLRSMQCKLNYCRRIFVLNLVILRLNNNGIQTSRKNLSNPRR